MAQKHRILIDYTNHEGKRAVREISPNGPGGFVFDKSEWHPEEQWLLHAYDHGKGAMRTFAMASIHRWGVEPGKQMEIDLSMARQLQRSMERNARMANRLKQLAGIDPDKTNLQPMIDAILRDEDPV